MVSAEELTTPMSELHFIPCFQDFSVDLRCVGRLDDGIDAPILEAPSHLAL